MIDVTAAFRGNKLTVLGTGIAAVLFIAWRRAERDKLRALMLGDMRTAILYSAEQLEEKVVTYIPILSFTTADTAWKQISARLPGIPLKWAPALKTGRQILDLVTDQQHPATKPVGEPDLAGLGVAPQPDYTDSVSEDSVAGITAEVNPQSSNEQGQRLPDNVIRLRPQDWSGGSRTSNTEAVLPGVPKSPSDMFGNPIATNSEMSFEEFASQFPSVG